MRKNILDQIENILDSRVRPVLSKHYGGIEILEYKEGILKVRMLGQCSGCPSAAVTNEELIEKEICEAIPQVHRVFLVSGVSDSLIEEARSLLSAPKPRKAL